MLLSKAHSLGIELRVWAARALQPLMKTVKVRVKEYVTCILRHLS